ncbi:hypothetical protein PTSG_09001 [Salpingoeca rosetta]|uniref:Trafficking protein particle complex subunit 6B n=1 Tax=Salpingoeca rosetta (strain ATCC 50818 / BSB-021) TaxID=946362 RepID=F2ULX4_SALR5|nr:uncharacterized protein PTSG_09001 [Salpingoeca rosetta]EGD78123.1 hypothetical protein PTSG_09001 [Salpingoeca rosetta]|eukprot:XP_004989799.1 hypothetical protein PTSG_09001 [Salpingoeca rosetta]
MATTALKTTSLSAVEFLVAEICRGSKDIATTHDARYKHVEAIGYRTGLALFESHSACISEAKKNMRFQGELDVIKYLCKDMWQVIFQKQIDNLRTNHKGVYVLHDNQHPMLTHLPRTIPIDENVQLLLAYPCGVIKGGLAALGITASVSAEITALPACKFNLDVRRA